MFNATYIFIMYSESYYDQSSCSYHHSTFVAFSTDGTRQEFVSEAAKRIFESGHYFYSNYAIILDGVIAYDAINDGGGIEKLYGDAETTPERYLEEGADLDRDIRKEYDILLEESKRKAQKLLQRQIKKEKQEVEEKEKKLLSDLLRKYGKDLV